MYKNTLVVVDHVPKRFLRQQSRQAFRYHTVTSTVTDYLQ